MVELAGEDRDLVRAEADYTLPSGGAGAFIEDLRLQGGFGDIDGSGNSLNNRLEGNSAHNTLRGLGGADSIEAGNGDDIIFGGGGGDGMEGESGADTLDLGNGDVAIGGSGADRFRFTVAAAFSGGGNSDARFAGTRQIQVDDDGDGVADQAFLVDGVTAANLLTVTDFLWL